MVKNSRWDLAAAGAARVEFVGLAKRRRTTSFGANAKMVENSKKRFRFCWPVSYSKEEA